MNIIKLGGSLISPKKDPPAYRQENVRTFLKHVNECKEDAKPKVVVHGAGGFGHIPASQARNQKNLTQEEAAFVRNGVFRLQGHFSKDMADFNMTHYPASPMELFDFSSGEKKPTCFLDNAERIDKGIITWGDVVFQDGKYRIYSGDEAVYDLAKTFHNHHVIEGPPSFKLQAIFVTDVPGVLDRETGEVIKRLKEPLRTEESGSDVTGGMGGKLYWAFKALSYCRKVEIVSLEDLPQALAGESPGTSIGG